MRQLREARFSEVDEIVVGGDAHSPIEVAKRVKTDEEVNSLIPGTITPNVQCPLTDGEVRELYATNPVITRWDESQLSISQPVVTELVGHADFRLRGAERVAEAERANAHRPDLWKHAEERLTSAQLATLHRRIEDMRPI